MRASVYFTLGESHQFRFTVAGMAPLVLDARVVHSMLVRWGSEATYVVGLEFNNQHDLAVADVIESLLQQLS
jgi:hypothetical protein